MSNVNDLRKLMREQRKALTKSFQEEVSKQIVNYFTKIKNIQAYNNIGVYAAFEGEVDLKHIIEWCWKENKKVFLPKLQSTHKSLFFCEYHPTEILKPNRFGILEPQNDRCMDVADLDLILIPLVAFDEKGHRLGMGQGYYDHTLAGATRQKPIPTLYIGVGYAFQGVEALAPHAHDVRLDGVLTENGLMLTKS